MRLLLYGGTFDPPHNGHLNNLRAAAARVRPDRVVVMPAGLSPFKQSTAAPGSARVEMCACFRALEAEGAVPALCVSGWEVEQAALGRRNYTVLTLEMLARTYPEAELYMAMGSDMLLSFDSWHRWQEILRLARLVVTSRNVGDAPELHAKAKQMDPTGARILFAQVEALPMASSNLRARLAAGGKTICRICNKEQFDDNCNACHKYSVQVPFRKIIIITVEKSLNIFQSCRIRNYLKPFI